MIETSKTDSANRVLTWARQVNQIPMARLIADLEIPEAPQDRTWDLHTAPVLWDGGGTHVVVDVVCDLEYAIVDYSTRRTVRRIPLDFKKACDFAYDLDCAARRG